MTPIADLLTKLANLPADWHGAGCLEMPNLEALARHAAIRRIRHSVETGAGKSTLLLSHLSEEHVVFAIDAGESHVCAITDSERTVACWGAEPAKRSKTETGSLDTDTTDETPAIVGALEIGAGRTHSCALIEDGTVACWGMGQDNQAVGQDGPFVHLAVGAQHNCALDDAGVVSCWGDNGDDESDPPEGGGPYDRISAGDEFTCAVDRDGHIVCWGNNDLDQSHPPG